MDGFKYELNSKHKLRSGREILITAQDKNIAGQKSYEVSVACAFSAEPLISRNMVTEQELDLLINGIGESAE